MLEKLKNYNHEFNMNAKEFVNVDLDAPVAETLYLTHYDIINDVLISEGFLDFIVEENQEEPDTVIIKQIK